MYIFNWVLRDTTSPNGKFYCTIKEPISLNPSTFGSPIAFYNVDGNLLYYNSKAVAHELHYAVRSPSNKLHDKLLVMAAWSRQGNMVYVLEYFKKEAQYYNLFINLKDEYQIWERTHAKNKANPDKISWEVIDALGACETGFDEDEVLAKLTELGLDKKPLTKDKIRSRTLFQLIFGKGKWYK